MKLSFYILDKRLTYQLIVNFLFHSVYILLNYLFHFINVTLSMRIKYKTIFLSFVILSGNAISGEKEVIACIEKERDILSNKHTRDETVTFGLHAAKGKPPQCNTSTAYESKAGEGPRENEIDSGLPTCKVVSARIWNRAKITGCSFSNGKPVLSASVDGKGCTDENSASFSLTQTYEYKPSTSELLTIMNRCQDEFK
ncbi:hypothetical protein DBZ36_05725 [Alginatibacterium sediminis]|uniref:DUF3617 family protein n=1 Tax=Alginatibacterium sediminis TaxID=2164068 RepID=A0A420EGV4_9ALTE|nr:hypothetical protein DBZ36_05725 [Alginatibacterium sediminis]